MKTALLVAVPAVAVLVVLRRRRRATAEQQLWDDAATASVERDLR